jgi:MoaA/NifB/PqqE/SkfB family radical SAM enzyme
MDHIDFHVSYDCLQKCVFCSSSDLIKRFHGYPLKIETIIALLKKKRELGFKSVHFTGGEASIIPSFELLVKETKKIGYTISVGSNGGKFEEKLFCSQVAPHLDEVCFSIHGHIAKLHNSLVGDPESFERLNRAIAHLSNFSTRVFSNTVVNKFNFAYLRNTIKSIISKGIKQLLFSNVAPEARGLKNYKKLAVRLKEIKKTVPALVKTAEAHHALIRFFGVPACVLGEFACSSNDFYWDERLTIELDLNKKVYLKEERCILPVRKRIKTNKCGLCFYQGICGGVFEEYLVHYGDKEIEPINCEIKTKG